jgi:hypothetical protein
MSQVIEGTWDEVKQRETELAGHRLMVVVDPPEPPNTFHNMEELEELLLEGFKGPLRKVTDESWDEIRMEAARLIAARKQS